MELTQRDSLSSGCDVFHPLISVPRIVENRKMENLRDPVRFANGGRKVQRSQDKGQERRHSSLLLGFW